MSAQTHGLLTTGFRPKMQAEIIEDITATLRGQFGALINLGAESVYGQIVGAFAEREALLWLLLESIYQAQFPSGAEGLAVDNLLAFNNLKRLPARASVTDPTPVVQANGITLYGLVLYGTAGSVIPAGSLVRSAAAPSHDFKLDAAVTIQPAVSAAQRLLLSDVPTLGTFALSLQSAGQTMTTRAMAYSTLANQSQVLFATGVSTGTFALMMGSNLTPFFDFDTTAAQIETAVRAFGGTFATATVAPVSNGFLFTWPASTYNPTISTTATTLRFNVAPASGSIALTVGGQTTALIGAPIGAAAIQSALLAIGYPRARVADAGGGTFAINFASASAVSVSVASNTTGATLTVGSINRTDGTLVPIDSLQGVINNLVDPVRNVRPFTDVLVTPTSGGFAVQYGAITPRPTEPSSASSPQALISVSQSSLQKGSTLVNVSVASTASGAPARGIGAATSTVTGPLSVAAGQLSVIGTPQAGWSSVINELDVLPGSDVESDTDALERRLAQLSSKANGPLSSIIEKVSLLPGVSNVKGFVNNTDAALQSLRFATAPTSGSYALQLAGGTTAPIAFGANAGQVQAAIAAVPGYGAVSVSGTVAFGMSIDFSGASGGQGQPLVQVVSNTTGVSIATAFGRPPRSVEIVVQGGAGPAIAEAIYNSVAAGTTTYGTPAAITTANTVQGNSIVTVASSSGIVAGLYVAGQGLQSSTQVVGVSGQSITLSNPALSTQSGVTLSFTYAQQVTDRFGNIALVAFSRPVPLFFYVTIALVTDQYRTPGLPSSGTNPAARFRPQNMNQIQDDVVNIGNASPIGGTVVGFGSSGLIGAFNEVPGVLGYQLFFGTSPNPSSNANVQMLPTQVATFQKSLVTVSYI